MDISEAEATTSIVRATADQVALITPLFLAYSEFYGRTVPPDAASTYLQDGLTMGASVILLAIAYPPSAAEGEALGFLQMHPSRSSKLLGDRWLINDLYVVPAQRRQHIGRRLLEAAQAYAAETQAKDLRLSTKVTNHAARAFYESLGWVALDEFVSYAYQV